MAGRVVVVERGRAEAGRTTEQVRPDGRRPEPGTGRPGDANT
jgi:hypothetical protein